MLLKNIILFKNTGREVKLRRFFCLVQVFLINHLEMIAGRILFNQFPTEVEVCEAVVYGGPYPATTDSRSTSVRTGAILRFARPVCFQGFPDKWLPDKLKETNPLGLERSES